jgi:hypothetical protein
VGCCRFDVLYGGCGRSSGLAAMAIVGSIVGGLRRRRPIGERKSMERRDVADRLGMVM